MIMTYRSFDEEPSLGFGGQSALEHNKGVWKMAFLEQFVLYSLAETIQLIMHFAAW